MNQSLFTILLGIALLFSACNSSKVVTQGDSNINDFEVLFQSEYGGNGIDEVVVIENQGDFASLWAQATLMPTISAPRIDFSKKMIIAKHFQSKNSGGTEYSIESVSIKENLIEVHYKAISPSEVATMAITNPLIILKVDKIADSKVEFIINN